jgi:pterin-4a-carbinolamine dehydratase
VYSRLTIRLTTHDVGGLSMLDFTMAEQIDALIARREKAS